jgi:hypothetical protein
MAVAIARDGERHRQATCAGHHLPLFALEATKDEPSTGRGGLVWSPPNPARKEQFMNLEGKVAIVTGGNSGIGRAIVLALAGAGAVVVVDYVANPDATDELEQQVVGPRN